MSQKKKSQASSGQPLKPTASTINQESTERKEATIKQVDKGNLVFGKDNFKWMFIGMGVMLLGYILMSGGTMPNPETWDPSLIYSFRRITLAPFIILLGLAIEVYAIFYIPKKKTS
ncbi:MAG: DUF3098 domain-containing protein [Saprospiraceae bacterium]|jgi:hypothetical protein|nr:DUF3098 domain-containing protein [Saprospiraceae bacterium]MBX7180382.1 DUF3098 domain-containing protein [Saprospiraceae bacterium]MCB0590021.1 DUF3098 domain-containing protein [Saprospiraceae bacterium]MCC7150263.1 DUF3098 domain-containing protein [Saprospiraceae bacterium]MCO5283226.1 DUF3098 domain-containing protein [Saprospiraceae bacterium]